MQCTLMPEQTATCATHDGAVQHSVIFFMVIICF
jgi:hypothetical protein